MLIPWKDIEPTLGEYAPQPDVKEPREEMVQTYNHILNVGDLSEYKQYREKHGITNTIKPSEKIQKEKLKVEKRMERKRKVHNYFFQLLSVGVRVSKL